MSELDEQIVYLERIVNELFDAIGGALPGFMAGSVVIIVFYVLAVVVRMMIRRMARRVAIDKHPLIDLGAESARIGLIALGAIMGLGTMGVDVSALVAGLGLTGFALSFALRDAVSNLLAGVLIIFYRPFGHGDRITVAGSTGTVSAVNFRYTVLEAEGQLILVPNSTMFSNKVIIEQG